MPATAAPSYFTAKYPCGAMFLFARGYAAFSVFADSRYLLFHSDRVYAVLRELDGQWQVQPCWDCTT